jgi:hypothetical protein
MPARIAGETAVAQHGSAGFAIKVIRAPGRGGKAFACQMSISFNLRDEDAVQLRCRLCASSLGFLVTRTMELLCEECSC